MTVATRPIGVIVLGVVAVITGVTNVAAVVLWYLYRPHVKAAFGRT